MSPPRLPLQWAAEPLGQRARAPPPAPAKVQKKTIRDDECPREKTNRTTDKLRHRHVRCTYLGRVIVTDRARSVDCLCWLNLGGGLADYGAGRRRRACPLA